MIPKNLSRTVQRAIADGDTEKAIAALGRSKTVKDDTVLLKNYHLISAQWNQLARDRNLNIQQDDDLIKRHNKINLAILELVDGDLHPSNTPSNTPANTTGATATANGESATLKYILYGIIAFFAIWGGITFSGMNSSYTPTTPPRTSTEKPILRAYKIYITNNSGQTSNVHLAKIYKDYTGELSIGGKKYRIDRVIHAEPNQMEFYFQNNGTYHYKYLLPKLSDVSAGYNTNTGEVLHNGRFVAKWMAEESFMN